MSTSNPFANPAPAGGGIDYAELNGRLLLIEPHSLEVGVRTSLGDKDAVRADVTVLDGTDPGTQHPDTLIFPKVLIGQLRSRLGQKVIGRLGQGVAKPGQNAPWLLHEATADDVQVGVAFLAGGLTTADANPPF